jgi:hypothetical protein
MAPPIFCLIAMNARTRAAPSRVPKNETISFDRIRASDEDDRNSRGCCFGRERGRDATGRGKDGNLPANQLGRDTVPDITEGMAYRGGGEWRSTLDGGNSYPRSPEPRSHGRLLPAPITGFPDRWSRPFRINAVITPAVRLRTDATSLPRSSIAALRKVHLA